MATTTNYSWTTPDDTALVKDGASAIRSLGTSIDTTTKALNPSTTLGDIEYRSSTANTNTRLGIGSTGQVLSVSGGVPSWQTPTSAGFVGVSVTNSTANFTLANDAETTITYDTEFYDTDAFHSTSSNTSRLTIPSGKAGKYLVIFTSRFQSNDTGVRNCAILKNGGKVQASNMGANQQAGQLSFQTTAIVDLAVGDYITTTIYQNSGGNLILYFATATPYNSYLSMYYIGA